MSANNAKKTPKRTKAQSARNRIADKNTFSPLRIAIFISALILFSLSGAALIDGLLSKNETTASFVTKDGADGNLNKTGPSTYTPARPKPPAPARNEAMPPLAALPAPYKEPEPYKMDKPAPIAKAVPEVPLTLAPPVMPVPKTALPPWKEFAVATVLQPNKPKIALVIDDAGLNGDRIDRLAQLPEVATISFLPYASHLSEKVSQIRAAGHEIMLHLPMEPTSKTENPGPNALYKSYSMDELRRLTYYNLNVFTHYVGVNNHMGSGFTADRAAMEIVLDILRDEGLLFLDSRTIGNSVGYEIAKERNVPTASRDIFLDNVIEEEKIKAQLMKTETLARANGIAIAIGHPHKLTISLLREWMPAAVARGFQFIPVSQAVTLNKQTALN